MPGAELAYGATRIEIDGSSCSEQVTSGICLRAWYAVDSTDSTCGGTSSTVGTRSRCSQGEMAGRFQPEPNPKTWTLSLKAAILPPNPETKILTPPPLTKSPVPWT
eukprot:1696463-Rhodomonas_salina.2